MRYRRYWEPVLAASGARLIEHLAGLEEVPARRLGSSTPTPATILDLGTGSGALAVAAARRWPLARVIGLDASAAMLSAARQRTAGLSGAQLEWLLADASAIPLPDTTADLVLSAFMLQLVPDRVAVLREAHRVLRRGARFGLVGWLDSEEWLTPDDAFDEAVYDLGLEDPEPDESARSATDFASPEEAEADLLAAGFEAIEVRPEQLEYAWTREAYLEFKEQYDEAELFESLSVPDRERLRERVVSGWASLPDEAFVLRAPIVVASSRRPG